MLVRSTYFTGSTQVAYTGPTKLEQVHTCWKG